MVESGSVRSNRRRGTRGRSVQVRVAWMWDGTVGEFIRVEVPGNLRIPISAIPKLPQGDSIHRVFLELRFHPMAEVDTGEPGMVSLDDGGKGQA